MKKLFLMLSLLFTLPAYSGGFLTPDNNATIAWINVEPNKVRVGVKHDNPTNPDECGRDSAVIFNLDSEYKKAQYSTLLAAYASGRKVRLYVNGCVSGWGSDYPNLQAVYSY